MTDFIALFPGQGSQSIGMMQNFATSRLVKKTFDEASDILNTNFWDMVNVENTDINQTINTQPLMLTVGIATWRVLKENNINDPSFAAGHSLGEFSALVAAKVFTFESGLHIVKKRAELMQNAVPSDKGAMAAILGLKDSEVINICNNLKEKGVIEAVNFNSPGQVVVAGGFADSKILQNHGSRMIEKDFAPRGKSITHLKDMNNILKCAEDMNVNLPISKLIQNMYQSIVDRGLGNEDHSALYKEILEQNKK